VGFKTKIQLIQRRDSQQWYVNFPSACAQMMNFTKGEMMEWEIGHRGELVLKRMVRAQQSRTRRA
jgi:hypothetical protein